MKCSDCTIAQDDVCSVVENTVSVELGLSLPASSGTLAVGIHQPRSRTRIIVEDSREPECCECSLNRARMLYLKRELLLSAVHAHTLRWL